MSYSTTRVYKMKRAIYNFSRKISAGQDRPTQKFTADMCYGILASGSCVLSQIAHELQEDTQKINTIDRLSRHLSKGVPALGELNYCNELLDMVPEDVVIHIDESDITKPCGKKFEDLCTVRDGSESTGSRPVWKPGYHVAEATVLTRSKQPVSIFSKIYSSDSADYISQRDVTFDSIKQSLFYFEHATFVMDRGYDDNNVIRELEELGQDFVIRLKMDRKVFLPDQGAWVPLEELCREDRGEACAPFWRHGATRIASLRKITGRLSSGDTDLSIIIVHGLADHPLMLVTNREIRNIKDLVHTASLYFSRWRIEEYFRSKKQLFQFEDFRVRKLNAINALNFYLSVCMAFLAKCVEGKGLLRAETIAAARPLKDKASFLFYRVASGILYILKQAHSALRALFPPIRTNQPQCHIRGFFA